MQKGPIEWGRESFPEEVMFEEVILEPKRALKTCSSPRVES